MPEHLYVAASFSCHGHAVDETVKILRELTENTLTEAGCISYSYWQSIDNPTYFTSVEQWSDSGAEAAHWKTSHLQDALGRLEDCLDGEADVTKYRNITV